VLGVDPDATLEHVRAAYRTRARALHPDRRGVADPAADAEMAAVNRAWATLRDAERRAAYDRALGLGERPPAGTPAPRRSPSNPPATHEPAPGCLVSVAGVGPWILVLAVLAAIFVFTAYAGNDPGGDGDTQTRPDPPMIQVRDIRGSCIGLANGATIVVDCFTVPHEGVIVAQASIGASCPEGTVEWLIRQQNLLACTEPGTQVRAP
jgi:hypothetical protein